MPVSSSVVLLRRDLPCQFDGNRNGRAHAVREWGPNDLRLVPATANLHRDDPHDEGDQHLTLCRDVSTPHCGSSPFSGCEHRLQ
jgi:hypothetical protein